MNNRLYRSPDDRIIGGVAGGIAETYDLDPALVRIGWAFVILVSGGLMLILYVIMILVVPLRPTLMTNWATAEGQPASPGGGDRPAATDEPIGRSGAPGPSNYAPPAAPQAPYQPDYRYGRRRHRGNGGGAIVVGSILVSIGIFLLIQQFIPQFDPGLLWPLIIIGGGILLIYAAYNRPRRQE